MTCKTLPFMGWAWHIFIPRRRREDPYLYVREIARVDGKPKVISQIYIGSPERVAALASDKADKDEKLKVEEFGALWVACQMDRDFDLVNIVDTVVPRGNREEGPTVSEYFLYAVLNRMVGAVSKNRLTQWYQQTAI